MTDAIDRLSLVQAASADYKGEVPTRFVGRSGASEIDLVRLARAARLPVPGELRDLLLQTDGIMEEEDYGRGFASSNWLIDPIEEMVAWYERLHEDEDYASEIVVETGSVFFFAGPGWDGVRFAFGDGARFPREAIVAYHPIDRELELKAPTFRSFLEQRARNIW